MTAFRKKLIEVALPLEAINFASAREKSIRHGHPSTLHLWWARRPLASARAVIFAQMVDDPSSHPETFPTEQDQEKERHRLFGIIEDLVKWDNTTDEAVLGKAREEIWKSWRTCCADNSDHPSAQILFNAKKVPTFYDPFAGGGTLPLEAQRLGLESYASDLNPVAVLINKAMIEIPPKFAGFPPVNPKSAGEKNLLKKVYRGAQGLAEDVRFYGQRMREEAEKRIGYLYPKIEITAAMASERKDLKSMVGGQFTVIAWLWARTVKSPNPAFSHADVPLTSTFMLSTKPGKEAYIETVVEGDEYQVGIRVGKPKDAETVASGTKLARANFRCLLSTAPIPGDYIKAQGQAGRIGARMMAMVIEGDKGRVYLPPTAAMESAAREAHVTWKPDVEISGSTQYIGVKPYGLTTFADLFTPRQLVALTTFSDLADEAHKRVREDAISAGMPDDGKGLEAKGTGATAYADAIVLYLSFCVDKGTLTNTTQATWQGDPDRLTQAFGRQALPMTWDYAEANPLSDAGGGLAITAMAVAKVLDRLPDTGTSGHAMQVDATAKVIFPTTNAQEARASVISTDPPYFDNVPYADLSDYFYVWLRRSLKLVFPELFATLAAPKTEELVAFAYRHKDKDAAAVFFMDGMTQAMRRIADQAHPAFPVAIYYAFRQSETEVSGTASTGWETFLDAVISAGFAIDGTWPMRTEYTGNLKTNRSALASSIILVCRPRPAMAGTTTRRDFMAALKTELPEAIRNLQHSNIAPVDMAQAAIGPGMAVYTRYSKVLDAEGKVVPVREALSLINQALDLALAEQEVDFDASTRWALAWFEQMGFGEGEYGVAEMLSKAKNTSIAGMVDAGILVSKGSKVRLSSPDELPDHWDPRGSSRINVWETVHRLIRVLDKGGERAAADLVANLDVKSEVIRELAYRLYMVCERKKRAQEALSYNGLVQSWPEIVRLSREAGTLPKIQSGLFRESEE